MVNFKIKMNKDHLRTYLLHCCRGGNASFGLTTDFIILPYFWGGVCPVEPSAEFKNFKTHGIKPRPQTNEIKKEIAKLSQIVIFNSDPLNGLILLPGITQF